jgi:hypothetical protein
VLEERLLVRHAALPALRHDRVAAVWVEDAGCGHLPQGRLLNPGGRLAANSVCLWVAWDSLEGKQAGKQQWCSLRRQGPVLNLSRVFRAALRCLLPLLLASWLLCGAGPAGCPASDPATQAWMHLQPQLCRPTPRIATLRFSFTNPTAALATPPRTQVKYPDGGFVGTFVKYMVPGCLLLILYALVIPAFWFAAVYLNRHKLDVRKRGAGGGRKAGACDSPPWLAMSARSAPEKGPHPLHWRLALSARQRTMRSLLQRVPPVISGAATL